MKLRNKKTGEIVSLQGELAYDDKVRFLSYYNSLTELNEEWEDYAPKEPLIKDETIRKAVRAWSEANRDVYRVAYFIDYVFYKCCLKDTDSDAEIVFNFININGVKGGKTYTITELCGEEEDEK